MHVPDPRLGTVQLGALGLELQGHEKKGKNLPRAAGMRKFPYFRWSSGGFSSSSRSTWEAEAK